MTLPRSAFDQVSGTVSEKAFMDTILQAAEIYGWFAYHTYDSRRSTAGFPDLVLIKPPHVLFLEVKRENGRLTVAQADVLALLWDCDDVKAAMVRPSDWEQIVEWLAA
jgi:hypothetical protein